VVAGFSTMFATAEMRQSAIYTKRFDEFNLSPELMRVPANEVDNYAPMQTTNWSISCGARQEHP
jgi:hypothetical protein